MSNRERIARAAAEAEAAAAEKASKKAAKKKTAKKKATKARAKRTTAPARMKVVWEVWKPSGATVKTFPYPEKAAAEAAMAALTKSTGTTHRLRATKVPMD